MVMNVTLPSGVRLTGIPDGTSKADIQSLAIKHGLATAEDFSGSAKPAAQPEQPTQPVNKSAPVMDAASPKDNSGMAPNADVRPSAPSNPYAPNFSNAGPTFMAAPQNAATNQATTGLPTTQTGQTEMITQGEAKSAVGRAAQHAARVGAGVTTGVVNTVPAMLNMAKELYHETTGNDVTPSSEWLSTEDIEKGVGLPSGSLTPQTPAEKALTAIGGFVAPTPHAIIKAPSKIINAVKGGEKAAGEATAATEAAANAAKPAEAPVMETPAQPEQPAPAAAPSTEVTANTPIGTPVTTAHGETGTYQGINHVSPQGQVYHRIDVNGTPKLHTTEELQTNNPQPTAQPQPEIHAGEPMPETAEHPNTAPAAEPTEESLNADQAKHGQEMQNLIDKLPVEVRLTKPVFTGDKAAISEEIRNSHIPEIGAARDAPIRDIKDNIAAVREQHFGPDQGLSEHDQGTALYDVNKQALDEMLNQDKQNWQALNEATTGKKAFEPAKLQPKVDKSGAPVLDELRQPVMEPVQGTGSFSQAITQGLKDVRLPESLIPTKLRQIVDHVESLGADEGALTVTDLESVRKAFWQEQKNHNLSANEQQAISAARNRLEELQPTTETAHEKELADTARSYRREMEKFLEKQPLMRDIREGKITEENAGELVPKNYVHAQTKSYNAEHLNAMKENVQGAADIVDQMQYDKWADAMQNANGALTPSKANAMLSKYGNRMDPALADKMDAMNRLAFKTVEEPKQGSGYANASRTSTNEGAARAQQNEAYNKAFAENLANGNGLLAKVPLVKSHLAGEQARVEVARQQHAINQSHMTPEERQNILSGKGVNKPEPMPQSAAEKVSGKITNAVSAVRRGSVAGAQNTYHGTQRAGVITATSSGAVAPMDEHQQAQSNAQANASAPLKGETMAQYKKRMAAAGTPVKKGMTLAELRQQAGGAPKPKVTESSPAGTGSVKQQNAVDPEHKKPHFDVTTLGGALYGAIMGPEADKKDPWMRNKVTTDSSAVGPAQVTGTLIRDFAVNHSSLFTKDELEFMDYMQQMQRLTQHATKGSGFGLGESGLLDNPHDRAMYDSVVQKMLEYTYDKAGGDMRKTARIWATGSANKPAPAGYEDNFIKSFNAITSK